MRGHKLIDKNQSEVKHHERRSDLVMLDFRLVFIYQFITSHTESSFEINYIRLKMFS